MTLTLPDDLLRQAKSLAALSGRTVAEVLAKAIELSFRPLGVATDAEEATDQLPDSQLLATADLQLPPDQDERPSELLGRQQEGALDHNEGTELRSIMASYQLGLLRKARALREAVRRGLREPPEP